MTGNIQRDIKNKEIPEFDYHASSHYLTPARDIEHTKEVNINSISNIKMLLNHKKQYLKGCQLFANQQIPKKRDRIAINAKEISAGSNKVWIWAAVDLNDEIVIAVYASYIKSRSTTYHFLKNVAKVCSGTLPQIFVNGGNWDAWAFDKLGFKYTPVDFGPGSAVEGFLLVVGARIRSYLGKFNNQNTPVSMLWWLEGAAGYINEGGYCGRYKRYIPNRI